MHAPPETLVVGATGFVGRALVARLVGPGPPVRALVRDPRRMRELPPGTEGVLGDVTDAPGLRAALRGIRVVYYLVHSMAARPRTPDFATIDRIAARNLVDAASAEGVDRIVYLGGLGDDAPFPSAHLASRREVGQILRSGSAAVTQLRAGIVIGPGGSSFEMMVQLVERLPAMICPRWIDTRCQPIARDDLVRYLVGCGRDDRTRGGTFDVGGPDVAPYAEILMRIGTLLGRRPCLLVLPRFTPSLSAHWVGFITEVPSGLARPVIDGMYSEAVCRESRIRALLPGPLLGLDEALRAALRERARGPTSHRVIGGRLPHGLEGRVVRLRRRGLAPPVGGP